MAAVVQPAVAVVQPFTGDTLCCLHWVPPGAATSAQGAITSHAAPLQAKAVSKKHKPDIVLYVDRMDVLRRAGSDLPVLRQISAVLGATTWFNTVRPCCGNCVCARLRCFALHGTGCTTFAHSLKIH